MNMKKEADSGEQSADKDEIYIKHSCSYAANMCAMVIWCIYIYEMVCK